MWCGLTEILSARSPDNPHRPEWALCCMLGDSMRWSYYLFNLAFYVLNRISEGALWPSAIKPCPSCHPLRRGTKLIFASLPLPLSWKECVGTVEPIAWSLNLYYFSRMNTRRLLPVPKDNYYMSSLDFILTIMQPCSVRIKRYAYLIFVRYGNKCQTTIIYWSSVRVNIRITLLLRSNSLNSHSQSLEIDKCHWRI